MSFLEKYKKVPLSIKIISAILILSGIYFSYYLLISFQPFSNGTSGNTIDITPRRTHDNNTNMVYRTLIFLIITHFGIGISMLFGKKLPIKIYRYFLTVYMFCFLIGFSYIPIVVSHIPGGGEIIGFFLRFITGYPVANIGGTFLAMTGQQFYGNYITYLLYIQVTLLIFILPTLYYLIKAEKHEYYNKSTETKTS